MKKHLAFLFSSALLALLALLTTTGLDLSHRPARAIGAHRITISVTVEPNNTTIDFKLNQDINTNQLTVYIQDAGHYFHPWISNSLSNIDMQRMWTTQNGKETLKKGAVWKFDTNASKLPKGRYVFLMKFNGWMDYYLSDMLLFFVDDQAHAFFICRNKDIIQDCPTASLTDDNPSLVYDDQTDEIGAILPEIALLPENDDFSDYP